MLTVLVWKWGNLFSPEYVNRMRSMLARHLHLPHELVCVTDDPAGIETGIKCVPITEFTDTPRCRRRMKQYDPAFASSLGSRILSIDLDNILVDDITPLVDRPEPLVLWCVGYACAYSGSFVLYDPDALGGLWSAFAKDPEGYPRSIQPRGVPSDQAMLNHWVRKRDIPHWTEADGFTAWFGPGYESRAHHGLSPANPNPPPETRIVVFGSDDKAIIDERQYPWITEHWR